MSLANPCCRDFHLWEAVRLWEAGRQPGWNPKLPHPCSSEAFSVARKGRSAKVTKLYWWYMWYWCDTNGFADAVGWPSPVQPCCRAPPPASQAPRTRPGRPAPTPTQPPPLAPESAQPSAGLQPPGEFMKILNIGFINNWWVSIDEWILYSNILKSFQNEPMTISFPATTQVRRHWKSQPVQTTVRHLGENQYKCWC